MEDRIRRVVEAAERFLEGAKGKHPVYLMGEEAYILAASLWRAFPREARRSFAAWEHMVLDSILMRLKDLRRGRPGRQRVSARKAEAP